MTEKKTLNCSIPNYLLKVIESLLFENFKEAIFLHGGIRDDPHRVPPRVTSARIGGGDLGSRAALRKISSLRVHPQASRRGGGVLAHTLAQLSYHDILCTSLPFHIDDARRQPPQLGRWPRVVVVVVVIQQILE